MCCLCLDHVMILNFVFGGADYGSNAFQGYFDDAKESRVKQIPKIQESSFKNQDSRFKNQVSRIKIQE